MISDRSDFRAQIQRLFVNVLRMSYRWISSHPFLLSFVGFLYFLHRTCPLLFSPLVTASPVLICTFVLLGTILSFGEPNIPEIEKEPEIVQEASHLRTEVSRNATVVERGDKSFTVEKVVSTENGLHQDGNDDADRLGENQLSEVEDDVRSFDYRPLVDETLDEVERYTQVRFEEKELILDLEKRQGRLKEKLTDDGGMQVSDAEQSRKNGGSLSEILDDSKEDQVDLSPISPWRPMRQEDDEHDDADRDDSMDSGSDGAESSSPDASMTDIIPMLDELHPLLHSEAPSRGIADGDGSDASSEGSDRSSSDEGTESDVDSESHGEEGDNENEEEDEDEEEEEEEKKEDKLDESKSAIKWTEVDQRNVMDLGSLELERNQRLENLIARRRARHNMRLMAERNLIDFDSADIPFNMPPISTARNNPFDLPYDSYDDMGLPPIPGSAPSIMHARKNPFDLPYEPNEEKPDLKGDGVREEFSSPQPKDPVFRRHESFSVGPSMLGGARHDRLRPFFVLEKLATEGTSYYPFERQLSEISESKVSSVPDTESVCTIMEDDEKKVDEHDADHETETSKVDMSSDHDEVKSHSSSDHDEVKSHSASDHEEDKSHSSEDSDFHGPDDNRNIHHDVPEIILGSGDQSNMMEGATSDKEEDDEEDLSDSDSSLSEAEEKVSDFSENESLSISERKVDLHEESGTSFEDLDVHVTRGVEDDYHHDETHTEDSITANPSLDESTIDDLRGLVDSHHVEPVFDLSPSASRFPSFSSVSSDYKPDLLEKNGEEVREIADKETEVYSDTIEPTEIYSTYDETETRSREVGETSTRLTGKATFSESDFEDALPVPSSLPLDKNENADHQEDEPLSVSSLDDLKELHEDVKETLDTRAIDVGSSSVGLVSPAEEEEVTTLESPDVVHDIAETSVNRSVAEGMMNEEDEAQQQRDEESPQTLNSNIPIDSYSTLSSGAVEYVEMHSFNEETHPTETMDIEVDSVNASGQNVGSGEATSSESHRELTWSDKSVVEQSSLEPDEDQVQTRAGVVFSRNITFHEYHDAPEDSAELSSLTSGSSSLAESPEYKTPMVGEGSRAAFFQEAVYDELDDVVERLEQLTDLHEISQSPEVIISEEADEIKEIDEGLLSELDTIGDFNVKEVVTDSEPGPSSIVLDTANEPGPSSIGPDTPNEPGPSSTGPDTTNELTEALPVLEVRSLKDMESAFLQIHEGSEIEDVILPSTVQDQLAQEHTGTSTETISGLSVVEATSKQELDSAMNQAVIESMSRQPGPSSTGPDTTNELTEALPVLEVRSLEDMESAFLQIHEGSEIEDVILPSTVQDQLAQEHTGTSTETISGLSVVEATSKHELDSAMNQAAIESMSKQPKSPKSDETEPAESLVEERALDETNNPLNITHEREEDESRTKEITSSDASVSPVETQTPEELQECSESKEEMKMEINAQRDVTPIGAETPENSGESIGSSNVTLSDESVTTAANVETVVYADADVQSHELKDTPENAGESIGSRTLTDESVTTDANAEPVNITDVNVQTLETKEETQENSGEGVGSSNVTLSDEIVTTDANAETVNNTDANVQTPENPGESIGSSTVIPRDESVTTDVNAETVNNTDVNVKTPPELKETQENSGESIGSSNVKTLSDESVTKDVNVQTPELKETPENPGESITEKK